MGKGFSPERTTDCSPGCNGAAAAAQWNPGNSKTTDPSPCRGDGGRTGLRNPGAILPPRLASFVIGYPGFRCAAPGVSLLRFYRGQNGHPTGTHERLANECDVLGIPVNDFAGKCALLSGLMCGIALPSSRLAERYHHNAMSGSHAQKVYSG